MDTSNRLDDVEYVLLHPVITMYKNGTHAIDWDDSFVACYDEIGDEVTEIQYVPPWGLLDFRLVKESWT